MPRITIGAETLFIGRCLEGFFYGLYSAIFVMYLQYQASQRGSQKMKNILFFALCALYVLSVATIVIDTIAIPFLFDISTLLHIGFAQDVINGCCDVIPQSILIYRCWIVWGCNARVVILPSILAFAFLATWLAAAGSTYINSQGNDVITYWGYVVALTSLAISLTVNALVTGLIVFKIFKVYREVKPTLDNKDLGVTGGTKLRSIIFILIESGIVLFAVQFVRVVLVVLSIMSTDFAFEGLNIVVGIHEMLNGITPTIILVRVSMGLSFHDQESLVEVTTSLRFEPDNPQPIPEMGTIGMEHESRDESDDMGSISIVWQGSSDDVGVQLSNDIQVVDR